MRRARAVAATTLLAIAAAACGSGGEHDATCPWSGAPQLALDLRAKVTPNEVPLLGTVVLTLDLWRADGVQAPFEPAVPEGFRARSGDEVRFERRLDGGTWAHRELVLQAVALGELTIPPYRVEAASGGTAAGTVATSAELRVRVNPVLTDAAGQPASTPEPPRDPFPPRPEAWPWIVAAGAALAVGLLCWWLLRRRRRPAAVPLARPLSPHEKALRALARLRQAPRATPEQVEAFYVQVSAVLRSYLEEQLGLRAPERTTEEFLAEAQAHRGFDTEQRLELRRFLEQCDLVKFAAVIPAVEVHDETLAIAERFVERTRPGAERRSPAPAPTPAPVGGAS